MQEFDVQNNRITEEMAVKIRVGFAAIIIPEEYQNKSYEGTWLFRIKKYKNGLNCVKISFDDETD